MYLYDNQINKNANIIFKDNIITATGADGKSELLENCGTKLLIELGAFAFPVWNHSLLCFGRQADLVRAFLNHLSSGDQEIYGNCIIIAQVVTEILWVPPV